MVSIIQIKDENEYEELIEYLKNKKYPDSFDKNKKKVFQKQSRKIMFYKRSAFL